MKRGFTLTELLVVIAIVGILASVVFVATGSGKSKARDAKRQADIKQIAASIELYKRENGTYPNPTTIGVCNWQPLIWSFWGTCWQTALKSTGLLDVVPVDPQNIDLGSCSTRSNCRTYAYCASADGYSYAIGANLENPQAIPQTDPTLCTMETGGNLYWIGSE